MLKKDIVESVELNLDSICHVLQFRHVMFIDYHNETIALGSRTDALRHITYKGKIVASVMKKGSCCLQHDVLSLLQTIRDDTRSYHSKYSLALICRQLVGSHWNRLYSVLLDYSISDYLEYTPHQLMNHFGKTHLRKTYRYKPVNDDSTDNDFKDWITTFVPYNRNLTILLHEIKRKLYKGSMTYFPNDLKCDGFTQDICEVIEAVYKPQWRTREKTVKLRSVFYMLNTIYADILRTALGDNISHRHADALHVLFSAAMTRMIPMYMDSGISRESVVLEAFHACFYPLWQTVPNTVKVGDYTIEFVCNKASLLKLMDGISAKRICTNSFQVQEVPTIAIYRNGEFKYAVTEPSDEWVYYAYRKYNIAHSVSTQSITLPLYLMHRVRPQLKKYRAYLNEVSTKTRAQDLIQALSAYVKETKPANRNKE